MKSLFAIASVLFAALVTGQAQSAPQYGKPPAGQPQQVPPPQPISPADMGPVPLDWTPPALSWLSSQAAVKNSFTLDRDMLMAAASSLAPPDDGTKQAIGHLDGVSVHMLKFANGVPDEAAVQSMRNAYHLRGWKHVVTTAEGGSAVHNGTTDLWMVVDGINLRGAVILMETPNSVTLATVVGTLSPVDLLHLRGHFGIPRFDSDHIAGTATR